jgi:hypothetical protein
MQLSTFATVSAQSGRSLECPLLGTIAGSRASETVLRKKRAKRLDFRSHEVGEGPHSGSVLHVAVREQVEWQH